MSLKGYTGRVVFTQDQVNEYIRLSGDDNKLHYDFEYCKTTPFKKPIVHGMLASSVFSKYFGGNGGIYLIQELKFKKPIYVGVEYTVEITLTNTERNHEYITRIIGDDICVDGKAVIKYE